MQQSSHTLDRKIWFWCDIHLFNNYKNVSAWGSSSLLLKCFNDEQIFVICSKIFRITNMKTLCRKRWECKSRFYSSWSRFTRFSMIFGSKVRVLMLKWLTRFMPIVHIYIPWKHQKTRGFPTISGGIEIEYRREMG